MLDMNFMLLHTHKFVSSETPGGGTSNVQQATQSGHKPGVLWLRAPNALTLFVLLGLSGEVEACRSDWQHDINALCLQ